jgi:trehalose/maltose transport system substrate-binding protein
MRFVGSVAGALALVASLAVAAVGTAGNETAAAPAPVKPPTVPNAKALKAKFGGTSLTFLGDGPVGKSHTRDKLLVAKFSKDTGIKVKLVPHPADSSASYSQLARTFSAKSSAFDVMMLDVTWPGAFAQYLLDLKPALARDARAHSAGIIKNNTINGKLVAMPWFGDFGILYYRTDLLQKYSVSVPKTWQELQQAAQKIQDGEKGANANFAGFVFQGSAYEGLTCNGLEWFVSNGAGQFVDNNKKVTINSPAGVQTLNLLKSFVGAVSPRGVTTFKEDETAQTFTNGNAAFARNWPYMYAIAGGDTSAVKGKFDVAALPAASGQKPAGTLGGWQLGISRFSRAQDAAIEFVRYMCGPDVVAWRGVVGSYVPLQQGVLNNAAVQTAQPYLKNLGDVVRVARPSNALGEDYNQGSTIIFQAFNNVLNGGDATQQLQNAQSQLEALLR